MEKFEELEIRGARVKDFLEDHPSLAHTCPSTKISQEICRGPNTVVPKEEELITIKR